jgi:hypothetical protein
MAIRSMAACLLAVALAGPAWGAKWVGGCPRVKYKFKSVGKDVAAISRYFEHVGHEVTYFLRDGGLSTEPDATTIEVTFLPPGHDDPYEIPLPPFTVTATSPTTVTFVMPDSRPALGRLVVGPARIVVKNGTTELGRAYKPIILPPMNDVRALVNAGYDVEVLGAMDKGGRIWIPLGFRDFGETGSPLAECPTILTPVTAFALDASLKKGEDQLIQYVHMGQLQRNKLFLGDYLLLDPRSGIEQNMYGNRLAGTQLNVKPTKGHGVALCQLNDALELIVQIRATNPALKNKDSELLPLVRDGSPVVLKLENISLDPTVAPLLQQAQYDSLGEPCYPAP